MFIHQTLSLFIIRSMFQTENRDYNAYSWLRGLGLVTILMGYYKISPKTTMVCLICFDNFPIFVACSRVLQYIRSRSWRLEAEPRLDMSILLEKELGSLHQKNRIWFKVFQQK